MIIVKRRSGLLSLVCSLLIEMFLFVAFAFVRLSLKEVLIKFAK